MNFFLKATSTSFSLPYWFDNAAFAETVATGRLHRLPQSHQTDRTLVFAFQGRVELHVVSLRFLGERAGRVPSAAAHAGALLLGRGAAGAGHGCAAAALPVPGSTAAVTVQQAHGSWARLLRVHCNGAKTRINWKDFRTLPPRQE